MSMYPIFCIVQSIYFLVGHEKIAKVLQQPTRSKQWPLKDHHRNGSFNFVFDLKLKVEIVN